jgi:hypothetical protein
MLASEQAHPFLQSSQSSGNTTGGILHGDHAQPVIRANRKLSPGV